MREALGSIPIVSIAEAMRMCGVLECVVYVRVCGHVRVLPEKSSLCHLGQLQGHLYDLVPHHGLCLLAKKAQQALVLPLAPVAPNAPAAPESPFGPAGPTAPSSPLSPFATASP